MSMYGFDPSGGPLRRRTDRLRTAVGWVVVVTAVFVVACAGAAASSAYRAGLVRVERDAAARTMVVGTLLDDATPAGSGPAQPARISYVDPQGRARIGQLSVSGSLRAGTPVRVEVDGAGDMGVAPPSRRDALFSAAVTGAAVSLLGAVLLAVTWFGAGSVVAARNRAAWEREWRLVEPLWSGRGRTAL